MPSPGAALRAPLLWLLLPYMAGVALADAWPPARSLLIGVALAAAGIAVAGAAANRPGRPVLAVLSRLALAAAGTGCGYVSLAMRQPPPPAGFAPREAVVVLEIDQLFPSAPDRKTANGLGRIVAAGPRVAEAGGRAVYFSALKKVGVPPATGGQYLARGVLQVRPPPGAATGFDRYLAGRGLRLELGRVHLVRLVRPPGPVAAFRERARHRLEDILRRGVERHGDAVAIYLGMLLGEKSAVDPSQQDAFRHSGTFHIFVVAGLHVGVIALAIDSLLLLLRVPRRPGAIAGLALLWLYVEVTGAGLPARRALVMIAFLHGARVFRVPGNALAALTLSALVTLLADPAELFDAGFQMSYTVVAALVVMGAPLSRRWEAAWRPWHDLPEADHGRIRTWILAGGRKGLGLLAISWVAFLASTASMIGNFGLLSPGSLLANLAVIPLAMFAISAGFTSLVAGLAHFGGVSSLYNHAAIVLIRVMQFLVVHGAGLPGVYVPAQFAQPWMAPATLVLVLAAMFAGASLRWRRSAGGFWPPAAVLLLAVLLGVKFGPFPPKVEAMKSAYELAMERLAKADPPARTLSEDQKRQLAEIDRLYQGRIAEREIFLRQQLEAELAAQKFEEADKVRQQMAREKARLEEEREDAKERVRRSSA